MTDDSHPSTISRNTPSPQPAEGCFAQCLLSTTYFGPVQWYQKLYRYRQVWMEQHDSFVKQTYRNRCCVAVLMSSPFYVNHPAMASAGTESIGNVAPTPQILTAKTAKLLKIKTFL